MRLIRFRVWFAVLSALLCAVASAPRAHAVKLLVSSHNNNSVLPFDGATGAFRDRFIPQGAGGHALPHGLAFGPDGNLYVSNRYYHSVPRFNGKTGRSIDTFVPIRSGGLNTPIG